MAVSCSYKVKVLTSKNDHGSLKKALLIILEAFD